MSLAAAKKLLSEGADNDELVESLSNVQRDLENHSPEDLADLINLLADWISKHSSSKKLESVLDFCVNIFHSQGYSEEFSFPLNDEPVVYPCTNFVSCVLSLVNSILKSNQAEKYIKIFVKLLALSSFIIHQKSVPDSFRRKGTLKLMLVLYKNLIKAKAKSEHSLKVLCLMNSIFSKMAHGNSKCRDYIVRKGGVQIFSTILSPTSGYVQETKFISMCLYALGALAGNNDQQLLVWVSGGVTLGLSYFEIPEHQESAAFLLWRSCVDAFEVQEILYSSGFAHKAFAVLDCFPSPETSTFLIGVIRRLSNNAAYKNELSGPASKCFLIWLKELTKKPFMIPLKELAAGLGSLCTILEVAQEVVKAAGIEIIIEVVLRHSEKAKLVKTCVGALVNLSVQEGIVDRIASNLKFYEMIDMLFSTYNTSNFIMEYVLKLVLNGLQNSNCLYHLSHESFLKQIIKVLGQSANEDDIFLLIVCILRAFTSHSIS